MNRIQKRDSTLQKPIIVLIDGDPALSSYSAILRIRP
jgi:hypothetical protein